MNELQLTLVVETETETFRLPGSAAGKLPTGEEVAFKWIPRDTPTMVRALRIEARAQNNLILDTAVPGNSDLTIESSQHGCWTMRLDIETLMDPARVTPRFHKGVAS